MTFCTYCAKDTFPATAFDMQKCCADCRRPYTRQALGDVDEPPPLPRSRPGGTQPVSFPKPMFFILGAGALIGGFAGGTRREPFSVGWAISGFLLMGGACFLLGAYLTAQQRWRQRRQNHVPPEIAQVFERMLGKGLFVPRTAAGRTALEVVTWTAAFDEHLERLGATESDPLAKAAAVVHADSVVKRLIANGHDIRSVTDLSPREAAAHIAAIEHADLAVLRRNPAAPRDPV